MIKFCIYISILVYISMFNCWRCSFGLLNNVICFDLVYGICICIVYVEFFINNISIIWIIYKSYKFCEDIKFLIN